MSAEFERVIYDIGKSVHHRLKELSNDTSGGLIDQNGRLKAIQELIWINERLYNALKDNEIK